MFVLSPPRPHPVLVQVPTGCRVLATVQLLVPRKGSGGALQSGRCRPCYSRVYKSFTTQVASQRHTRVSGECYGGSLLCQVLFRAAFFEELYNSTSLSKATAIKFADILNEIFKKKSFIKHDISIFALDCVGALFG